MIIGVIGSGGREHAICFSLKNSNKIKEVFCFPGNAGTASIATNIDIDLNDFKKLKDFILKNQPLKAKNKMIAIISENKN